MSSVSTTTTSTTARGGRRFRRVRLLAVVAVVGLGATAMVPSADAATRRRVSTKTDYSIAISPDAVAVNAGGVASFPISVRTTAGYFPTLRWDVDGVPSFMDVSVRKTSTNRYRLDVLVPTNAPSSNGVYQLFGVTSTRERSALFRLVVNGAAPVTQPPLTAPPVTQPPVTSAPPNFGLRLDNPELTVATNQTAVFGLSVDRSAGYTGPVSFSLAGLPVGSTANFAPNPTTASTNLYITPGVGTPSGRYGISVSATAGTTVRTGTVALNVTAISDFQLVPTTPILTLNSPGKASTVIELRKTGAVTPTVSFSVAGVPTGATYSLSSTVSNKNVTLSVTTTASTPPGVYNIVVSGRSGGFTQQANVQLVVNNPVGFTLSASPSDFGIARGSGATTFVTLKSFGGFNGNVTLSVSGLPSGVTLRPGTTSVNSPSIIALIFDALPGATPTPSGAPVQVSIIGTSGALSATIKLNVAVV